MVINLSSVPQETIDKYDLIELAQDGKVYTEIQKGMYGLTEAGILANELLLMSFICASVINYDITKVMGQ
jgi:hypothetical protein